MTANAAERTWSLDREIVLTRVVDAPRELVFEAWTKPEHAMKWFGPKGFTCTLHEMDVRVGGRWRFDMFAPDGKLYPNRIEYLEIVPNERLVYCSPSAELRSSLRVKLAPQVIARRS